MRVAFDFEMCPLPEGTYTPRQQRRREMEVARILAKDPDRDRLDADRLARSTHSHLGWICAAALAWRDGVSGQVHTWGKMASTPDEEPRVLEGVLSKLDTFGYVEPVSFNGKRFDGPFFKMRCVAHGIGLYGRALALLHDHPYQDRPHLDLQRKVPFGYGLADVCEMVGLESPKGDIDGSQVAECVERGEAARVLAYCKRDTHQTLLAYEALGQLGAL